MADWCEADAAWSGWDANWDEAAAWKQAAWDDALWSGTAAADWDTDGSYESWGSNNGYPTYKTGTSAEPAPMAHEPSVESLSLGYENPIRLQQGKYSGKGYNTRGNFHNGMSNEE